MFKDNYSVKHSLKKLFLQRYERYLPTAFDESMSLLEKMNKLIESQNSIIDVVNNHVEFTSDQLERAFDIIDTNIDFQLKAFRDELEEQKTLYEEIRDIIHSDLLPDSVAQKLEEWLLNGTIENLLTGTVFPELLERIEQVENRVEEKELLQEVNIKDYEDLVVDGNWKQAFDQALLDSNVVIIPEGHYKTHPIDVPENRTITGRGNGTTIEFIEDVENNNYFHGFKLRGELGEIRRVTTKVAPNTDVVYLENTSGLSVGDDVLIKSQRNALSIEDAGERWFLGEATSNQKLPFGEFGVVKEVHSDHIVLQASLIYPEYNSHSGGEELPAQDYSSVQKVDFVSDVTIGNFKVTDMYSGYVVRAEISKNLTVHDVFFDDSNYQRHYTGVAQFTYCLSSVMKDSQYYTTTTTTPEEHQYMNVYKLVSCQHCGVIDSKAENATQSADFTYLPGHIPNTSCYIKDCEFINARQSGLTTHGGNYLSLITGNMISGTTQGINHRGNGGLIANNVVTGTNRNNTDSTLGGGILTYQAGAVANTITNNVVRNFAIGIGHTDGGQPSGRIRYSGTTITNNHISNCQKGINIFRMYTGASWQRYDYTGFLISDNVIQMSNNNSNSAVYGIYIGYNTTGVTMKNNIIKGIQGEMGSGLDRTNNYFGISFQGDNDKCRAIENSFIDLDRGISHQGNRSYDTTNFPNGVEFLSRYNERIRVRQEHNIASTVIDYTW